MYEKYKTITRLCDYCEQPYKARLARLRFSEGKFCSRSCASSNRISSKGAHWKGGKKETKEGYVQILSHKHPFKDNHGYVLEHRLIMEKHLGRYLTENEIVHHINMIKNDNKISNLQLTTIKEHVSILHPRKQSKYGPFESIANPFKCFKIRKNLSGYRGVHWDSTKKKFRASIKTENKHKHLGDFVNAIDAAKKYDEYAIKVFDKYACLNFPQEERKIA
jgi:hypothetical protein